MSNYIAQSTVLVRADTSPFRAQLENALKQTQNKKIVVQVVPNTVGFVGALNKQLRELTGIRAVRVQVVPDFRGFRTALAAGVKEAQKEIQAVVGVTPGVVARPARGAAAAAGAAGVTTGGVVDRRAAEAQRAVNAAVDAGVASRRRLTDAVSASGAALSVAEKRAARLQRELFALQAAETAVTKAAVSGNVALLTQAENLQRAARAAVERTQAQQARAAGPSAAEARAAEEAAAAKAALEADRAASSQRAQVAADLTTSKTKASADAVKAQERDLRKLVAADQAANITIRKNQAKAQAEQLAGILKTQAEARAAVGAAAGVTARRTQIALAAPVAEEAFARNQAVINSAKEAERAQTALARATRQETALAKIGGTAEQQLSAARAIERSTTDALVAAEVARNEALAAGLPELAVTRTEELRVAEARQAAAAAAVTGLEAQVTRAGRLSAGRRALEAFGATLAGLRGAALSAEGAFLAAGAGAILLTKAVQEAAGFEATLNTFKVTAGATADEMDRVSKTAIALGRDISLPGVSASDAADALTELSKAGLSVQDSIDGARGVLQLATAAQIDNATATNLAASALNAFGLSGDQAVRVADVLANAANASQGSIVDMGVALQQAAAVGRQAGLTLEQTVGVLTLFARAGLRGSDAGTSFRTALIRLINPTTKAQKEIDKLGLHLRTASGAINLGVFDEFAQKTRGLSAAQRDQALAIIFGQDAIRGAAILAREGTATLNAQIAGLGKSGTAAELAAARMSGLTGAVENLKNQLSTLGLTVGSALIPPLKTLADTMSSAIGQVNALITPLVQAGKAALDFKNKLIDIGTVDIGGISIGLRQIFEPFKTGVEVFNALKSRINDSTIDLKVARLATQGLAADFNKVGGATKLNETVIALQKLQKQLQGGDERSQAFAKDIGALITRLQKASQSAGVDLGTFKITLPPELLSGEPGALAGKAAADKFKKNFKFDVGAQQFGLPALVNNFGSAGRVAADKFWGPLQEGARRFIRDTNAAIRRGAGRLNVLQGQALDISIAGGPREQQNLLANAKQAETAARRQVERQRSLLKPFQKTSPALRKAQQDLKDILDNEESIRNQIASDAEDAQNKAEAKAKAIQDARDKADQAVLDALTARRERGIDIASIKAQGTAQLQDDLSVLLATKATIVREQKIISENVKNKKTQGEQLRAKAKELAQVNVDIKEKRQEIADQIIQGGDVTFQAKLNLAQARGNIPAQIALIRQRIKDIDKVIRTQKLVGNKLRDAKAEQENLRGQIDDLNQTRFQDKLELAQARDNIPAQIKLIQGRIKRIDQLIKQQKIEGDRLTKLRAEQASLRQQEQDIRDQQLADKTALAQSIADLTGNKTPLLRALDAEIANKKKEIAQAKAAGKSTVKLQTELNNLKIAKNEALGIAKDATSTTAFDILTENVQHFLQSAGNLISGQQPFAGPTGFTADIAQFLHRTHPGTATTRAPITPGGRQTPAEKATDIRFTRLIDALDRNTAALTGSKPEGANRVKTPKVTGGGKQPNFFQAREVREAMEG